MMIKVCGMREPDNIRAVAALGIDMMGLIFYPDSPRYVKMISSRAGIIPDYSEERLKDNEATTDGPDADADCPAPLRVGVFVDDMPQNIVTRIYNYRLDYVQLHGSELPVMLDNLRRTVDPDIRPGLKIIKAIAVRQADDIEKWRPYRGHADLLLFDTGSPAHGGSGEKFDWDILQAYDGDLPFLLSGGIGPEDAEKVLRFSHPKCIGIDVNSRFETEPGVKDVERLREFIKALRQQ